MLSLLSSRLKSKNAIFTLVHTITRIIRPGCLRCKTSNFPPHSSCGSALGKLSQFTTYLCYLLKMVLSLSHFTKLPKENIPLQCHLTVQISTVICLPVFVFLERHAQKCGKFGQRQKDKNSEQVWWKITSLGHQALKQFVSASASNGSS